VCAFRRAKSWKVIGGLPVSFNDAARLIEATRQYIYDFDEAVASSSRGEEVVSKMTAKYPDLGNPYTLWLASYTQPYGD
jgi:predicted metal-binding protein